LRHHLAAKRLGEQRGRQVRDLRAGRLMARLQLVGVGERSEA
jgi:hypothetical protein